MRAALPRNRKKGSWNAFCTLTKLNRLLDSKQQQQQQYTKSHTRKIFALASTGYSYEFVCMQAGTSVHILYMWTLLLGTKCSGKRMWKRRVCVHVCWCGSVNRVLCCVFNESLWNCDSNNKIDNNSAATIISISQQFLPVNCFYTCTLYTCRTHTHTQTYASRILSNAMNEFVVCVYWLLLISFLPIKFYHFTRSALGSSLVSPLFLFLFLQFVFLLRRFLLCTAVKQSLNFLLFAHRGCWCWLYCVRNINLFIYIRLHV